MKSKIENRLDQYLGNNVVDLIFNLIQTAIGG